MCNQKLIIYLLFSTSTINIGLLIAIMWQLCIDTRCRSQTTATHNIKTHKRIIGGHPVEFSQYKYMAAIVIINRLSFAEETFKCGASIISEYWLVTAAHCLQVFNKFDLEYIFIVTASVSWQHGIKYKIERYLSHTKYIVYGHDYDIGLIKTTENMLGSNILTNKVPYADSSYPYRPNSSAVVVGWGYFNNSKEITTYLRSVDVKLFSQRYCMRKYQNVNVQLDEIPEDSDYSEYYEDSTSLITLRMVCAGSYKGGNDACTFDSGGPLIQEGVLIGIVSWGKGCASKNFPGVYVRVSYFQGWIEDVLQELEDS